jgi:hypothetical protein
MTYKASLLIFNKEKKVLVRKRDARVELPQVDVEPGRVGISLSRAVREQLGMEVYLLIAPEATDHGFHILRLQSRRSPLANGFAWAAPTELPQRDEICATLAYVDSESREFGGYLWYDEVAAWISAQLERLGYTLRELEQWNGRIGGVLLRVATSGPDFWFKAGSDFNRQEMEIARLLSARNPKYFPRILAANSAWNAFLLDHIEGRELYDCNTLSMWEETATLLADIQMNWVGAGDSLLRAGAADLRPSSMSERILAFLDHIEAVMSRQPKTPPEKLTRMDLDELGSALHMLCADVASLDFSEGLANADFSPHNTILTSTGPVFIDWAEACVSLPLITGEYMWNRMVVESPERAPWQETLRAAYLSRWKERYGSSAVEEATKFLPAFSLFAVAMFYHERESHGPSPYDSYLRSLIRKLNQAVAKIYGQRYALQA